MVVAISWPSSCPFCYVCRCQHIQLGGSYFNNCLPNNSGGPFSEGGTYVWQCLVSTTCNSIWQLYNMEHSSIHSIGATLSWLKVLRLSLRCAGTLCNLQFAVLHSGAFVRPTSQHQKDWAILGFPWLVFRVCVWGCPLCLCSADMEIELGHVWSTNVWGYAEALDRFSSTDTIMVPHSAMLTFDPNPGLWR